MTFSTGIVENHNYNGHLIVWQTKTQDFAFAPKRCLAKILALNWHSWFNTAGYIKGAQNVLGYNCQQEKARQLSTLFIVSTAFVCPLVRHKQK